MLRSSVLQTWDQKCSSQTKHSDTRCVVAMTTLLVLGPSYLKLKFPVFALINQGLFTPANLIMRQYGNHVCSKQDPLSFFKGWKSGYLVLTKRDWSHESFHGNINTMGVIWFLLWFQYSVPIVKNTASVSPEMFIQ